MSKVKVSLSVFAGKSTDSEGIGRPAKEMVFEVETELDARLEALALLQQTARRWRTSDKFTSVELICRKEDSDRACFYCLRGRWVFKESILKLPLSFKNAERVWEAQRLIGGKSRG